MKSVVYSAFLISFSCFSAFAAPQSFRKAKQELKKLYPKNGRTFYCNCQYQAKSIKADKCGISLKKYKKRKYRLEWEHIVPAHAFGHSFKEWRNAKSICKRKGKKALSPRKCAAKKNKMFKAMEANLFNLVPAVGSVNAIRSNLSFTEIKKSDFPICSNGFKIQGRKVSPPDNRKGDIARIYLYMHQKYPGRGIISGKNQKLFNAWNNLDPVDKEECSINRKKALIQGEENPFVAKFCKGK